MMETTRTSEPETLHPTKEAPEIQEIHSDVTEPESDSESSRSIDSPHSTDSTSEDAVEKPSEEGIQDVPKEESPSKQRRGSWFASFFQGSEKKLDGQDLEKVSEEKKEDSDTPLETTEGVVESKEDEEEQSSKESAESPAKRPSLLETLFGNNKKEEVDPVAEEVPALEEDASNTVTPEGETVVKAGADSQEEAIEESAEVPAKRPSLLETLFGNKKEEADPVADEGASNPSEIASSSVEDDVEKEEDKSSTSTATETKQAAKQGNGMFGFFFGKKEQEAQLENDSDEVAKVAEDSMDEKATDQADEIDAVVEDGPQLNADTNTEAAQLGEDTKEADVAEKSALSEGDEEDSKRREVGFFGRLFGGSNRNIETEPEEAVEEPLSVTPASEEATSAPKEDTAFVEEPKLAAEMNGSNDMVFNSIDNATEESAVEKTVQEEVEWKESSDKSNVPESRPGFFMGLFGGRKAVTHVAETTEGEDEGKAESSTVEATLVAQEDDESKSESGFQVTETIEGEDEGKGESSTVEEALVAQEEDESKTESGFQVEAQATEVDEESKVESSIEDKTITEEDKDTPEPEEALTVKPEEEIKPELVVAEKALTEEESMPQPAVEEELPLVKTEEESKPEPVVEEEALSLEEEKEEEESKPEPAGIEEALSAKTEEKSKAETGLEKEALTDEEDSESKPKAAVVEKACIEESPVEEGAKAEEDCKPESVVEEPQTESKRHTVYYDSNERQEVRESVYHDASEHEQEDGAKNVVGEAEKKGGNLLFSAEEVGLEMELEAAVQTPAPLEDPYLDDNAKGTKETMCCSFLFC